MLQTYMVVCYSLLLNPLAGHTAVMLLWCHDAYIAHAAIAIYPTQEKIKAYVTWTLHFWIQTFPDAGKCSLLAYCYPKLWVIVCLMLFNYTFSLSVLVFDIFSSIAEHAYRMCGKRANTMEHQPNYVAVNYSSVIQVLKLAGTCSFPLQPACLKGLLTETTEEVMAINIS